MHDKPAISSMMNRKIKFNLLPKKFQNSLEEDNDEDWRVMVYPKFVALVQQCETKDEREREEIRQNREKLKKASKRKRDDEENLNRQQRSKNKSTKRFKERQESNGKGEAKYCWMCKAAGAPAFKYKSHRAEDCENAEEYKRKLSGGAGGSYSAKKSYQKELRKTENALKRLKKETRELKTMLKKGKKKSKNDDDMSIDSASTYETDTSM